MADQQALELSGRDLEALVLDQLLDTIGDVKVAVAVLVTDVAGLEVAVGCQRVVRAFRVIVVALEDIRAFNPELACVADGNFGAAGGHVFGGLVGE